MRTTPIAPGLVSVLLLAGCGSAEYGTVEGRITLDGKPLEGGFVRFLPEAPGSATVAYGKTDAEGNYEMAISDSHRGILPGTYRVEISTAGTTKLTEFMKLRCRPEQSTPVHALPQAFTHGSKVGATGSASRHRPKSPRY